MQVPKGVAIKPIPIDEISLNLADIFRCDLII